MIYQLIEICPTCGRYSLIRALEGDERVPAVSFWNDYFYVRKKIVFPPLFLQHTWGQISRTPFSCRRLASARTPPVRPALAWMNLVGLRVGWTRRSPQRACPVHICCWFRPPVASGAFLGYVCPRFFCVRCCFIVPHSLASLYTLFRRPPFGNSDQPLYHIARLFSPPSPSCTVRAFVLMARRGQKFLPSSTRRVEYTRLARSASIFCTPRKVGKRPFGGRGSRNREMDLFLAVSRFQHQTRPRETTCGGQLTTCWKNWFDTHCDCVRDE